MSQILLLLWGQGSQRKSKILILLLLCDIKNSEWEWDWEFAHFYMAFLRCNLNAYELGMHYNNCCKRLSLQYDITKSNSFATFLTSSVLQFTIADFSEFLISLLNPKIFLKNGINIKLIILCGNNIIINRHEHNVIFCQNFRMMYPQVALYK